MPDQPLEQAKQSQPKDLKALLERIEKEADLLKKEYPDASSIKDFRHMFDQESSQMNRAIFNNAPQEEICRYTMRTIAALFEILSRC